MISATSGVNLMTATYELFYISFVKIVINLTLSRIINKDKFTTSISFHKKFGICMLNLIEE